MDWMSVITGALGDTDPLLGSAGGIGGGLGQMGIENGMRAAMPGLSGNAPAQPNSQTAVVDEMGGGKKAVGELAEAIGQTDPGDERRKAMLKLGITAATGGAAAPFMGLF